MLRASPRDVKGALAVPTADIWRLGGPPLCAATPKSCVCAYPSSGGLRIPYRPQRGRAHSTGGGDSRRSRSPPREPSRGSPPLLKLGRLLRSASHVPQLCPFSPVAITRAVADRGWRAKNAQVTARSSGLLVYRSCPLSRALMKVTAVLPAQVVRVVSTVWASSLTVGSPVQPSIWRQRSIVSAKAGHGASWHPVGPPSIGVEVSSVPWVATTETGWLGWQSTRRTPPRWLV